MIMNVEAKCSCNTCGGHITFSSKSAGTPVSCPHCGLDTVLFVPPSAEAIRVAEYRAAHPELYGKDAREDLGKFKIIGGGYLLAILLPLFGFFYGIWLITKKESGHGCAVMAISIFCFLVWLSVLPSII